MLFFALKDKPFSKKYYVDYLTELTNFYEKLNTLNFDFQTRLKYISENYLDNPYQKNPLTEIDNLPALRLFETDCVTFVINTLALSAANNANEFIKIYSKFLYYFVDNINFNTRIHFTEERLKYNHCFRQFNFQELKSAEISQDCCLNRNTIKSAKLIDISFEKFFEWKVYSLNIDKKKIIDFFNNAKPLFCGIAFIKSANRNAGYLVAHEGLIIDNRLFHSSIKTNHITSTDNIVDYMLTSGFDCFVLFDLNFYYLNYLFGV